MGVFVVVIVRRIIYKTEFANSISVFSERMDIRRHIVTTIFNNWTALQLAVEHGFGTQEDALELVDYVTETLRINDSIDSSEMTDVLVEAMDATFRTECEDNSCEEIGALLSKFAKYSREESENFVLSELSKLPTSKLWLSAPVVEKKTIRLSDVQPMDVGDNKNRENDVDEDGWQKVKSRRY